MQFWETFYEVTRDLSANNRRAIEIERICGLFRTHGLDRRAEQDNGHLFLRETPNLYALSTLSWTG